MLFNSCKQDDAQTMIFEEEITTLIVKVYSCANDPLCPVKTPEINASVSVYEYVNEPIPSEEFFILGGKTDISGTYQTNSLEGSEYYLIQITTADSIGQEQLIRLDANMINEEEILFP